MGSNSSVTPSLVLTLGAESAEYADRLAGFHRCFRLPAEPSGELDEGGGQPGVIVHNHGLPDVQGLHGGAIVAWKQVLDGRPYGAGDVILADIRRLVVAADGYVDAAAAVSLPQRRRKAGCRPDG